MADLKPIGVDATGYELLSQAMRDFLNQFPGLLLDEVIKFEELGDDSGIAMSDDSGSLIYSEKTYVSGTKVQKCQYPFLVVYRTASTKERQKMSVKEFLDTLGKWICKEPFLLNGNYQRLTEYPDLTNGREIKKITRNNSYGTEPQENGVQDWVLPITVHYDNTFKPI